MALALGVIAIAALGFRIATDAGQLWGAAPHDATHLLAYEAASSGHSVVVTYTKGDQGAPGQSVGSSPWSADVSVVGNVAFLTVMSGNNADDGVACSIVDKATGRTLAHDSTDPASGGSVTCVINDLASVSGP